MADALRLLRFTGNTIERTHQYSVKNTVWFLRQAILATDPGLGTTHPLNVAKKRGRHNENLAL